MRTLAFFFTLIFCLPVLAQPYPAKPIRIVVPFPVGGIADLLAGQTSLIFATMPTALPHAKAGKLRALATTGSARAD